MSLYSVYIHITPSNKYYVGITQGNVITRWCKHGEGYKSQQLFWRAIQKYGWENIKHIVLLEGLTKEVACECEKYLIAKYKTNNPKYGYNVFIGGECGPLGISPSIETREKLRQANLGHHHSEETKEKIKQNHTHYNRGRKMSEEQKQKISKANLGKSAWNKGKKLSDEYRKKLSDAHKGHTPWNKGRKMTPDELLKHSKALKGVAGHKKGVSLSEVNKQGISKSLKNRIWVNNGEHRTLIRQEDLQQYLNKGYKLGKLFN
jgi:group I intron endonuclease